jgi:hypothetical protein
MTAGADIFYAVHGIPPRWLGIRPTTKICNRVTAQIKITSASEAFARFLPAMSLFAVFFHVFSEYCFDCCRQISLICKPNKQLLK